MRLEIGVSKPSVNQAACFPSICARLILSIDQQEQFVFAPDEWSQPTRCRSRFRVALVLRWAGLPVEAGPADRFPWAPALPDARPRTAGDPRAFARSSRGSCYRGGTPFRQDRSSSWTP